MDCVRKLSKLPSHRLYYSIFTEMNRFILVPLFLWGVSLIAQHNINPEKLYSNKLSTSSQIITLSPKYDDLILTDFSNRLFVLVQTTYSINKLNAVVNEPSIFNTKYGNIASGRITREDLYVLLRDENVSNIEIANRFISPRPLNDKSRTHSNVNAALESNGGSGVVLGIIDIGFQTTHPTFYNTTDDYNKGSLKIKRFWHQGYPNQDGPAPFKYGILFSDSSSITKAVDYDGTHGTHVAGIAGGSGLGGAVQTTIDPLDPYNKGLLYKGMAPKSDLVFVGIKYKNDTIGGSALGDLLVANNTILDGFDYVFNYADSVRMPAVCNLSWGMHTGPHDGTSLFDIALDAIVEQPNKWKLRNDGRIVVGANGNSATHNMHVKIEVNGDTISTLAMDRSRTNYKTENVYCDFWAEENSNLKMEISVIDSLDNEIVSTGFMDFHQDENTDITLYNNNDTFRVLVLRQSQYVNNGKSNNLVMAEVNSNKRFIKISFRGNGTVHGWNSGRTYEWTAGTFRSYIKEYKPNNWIEGDANNTMIENGGTAKNIISVGSYNNRVNWTDYTGVFRSDSTIPAGKISNFSSRGPTIDGRMKPDITAPGQYIASSYHKDQVPGWLKNQILSLDTFDGDPVYYAMASGTSMASPHVAGIVALALEKSAGLLDVERMKLVLESSYYRDGYTGSDANNTYGIGKIDAIQTLFNSIEFMNVVSDHENLAPVVIFNENEMKVLTNHNIQYENFKVYDLSARVLIQNSLKNNKIINLKPLPIGVYLVELNSKEGKVIGKVFKSN